MPTLVTPPVFAPACGTAPPVASVLPLRTRNIASCSPSSCEPPAGPIHLPPGENPSLSLQARARSASVAAKPAAAISAGDTRPNSPKELRRSPEPALSNDPVPLSNEPLPERDRLRNLTMPGTCAGATPEVMPTPLPLRILPSMEPLRMRPPSPPLINSLSIANGSTPSRPR